MSKRVSDVHAEDGLQGWAKVLRQLTCTRFLCAAFRTRCAHTPHTRTHPRFSHHCTIHLARMNILADVAAAAARVVAAAAIDLTHLPTIQR
jgi:hypothetical protein